VARRKGRTHNAYFATFEALIARVETRLTELARDMARVRRRRGTPLDDYAARLPSAA
jgi:hypothetical protein